MQKNIVDIDNLISADSLMARFEISSMTLSRWRKKKIIPEPVKIGGKRFFFRDAVNDLIVANNPHLRERTGLYQAAAEAINK